MNFALHLLNITNFAKLVIGIEIVIGIEAAGSAGSVGFVGSVEWAARYFKQIRVGAIGEGLVFKIIILVFAIKYCLGLLVVAVGRFIIMFVDYCFAKITTLTAAANCC